MTIASTVSTPSGKLAVKHPTTGLLCREDGAILASKRGGKSFAWTYGHPDGWGYLQVKHKGKTYHVHRLIAEAFLPNIDNKPEIDHIDRNKTNNAVSNLRWATSKENKRNRDDVDRSIEVHGVRRCDDPRAYKKSYNRRSLAILNAEGKRSMTGFLPDDIYSELKLLSPKERYVRYYAWKQNQT